jgi:hypothetical protein
MNYFLHSVYDLSSWVFKVFSYFCQFIRWLNGLNTRIKDVERSESNTCSVVLPLAGCFTDPATAAP